MALHDFTFRPLTRADLPDVVRWQQSEAAREWFHGGLTPEQAEERYGPRIDGRHPARMWVALLGGSCGRLRAGVCRGAISRATRQ